MTLQCIQTIYDSELQTGKESIALCIQHRVTVVKHSEEREAIEKASPS